MISRIVVALDGSELSREAFEYAAMLSSAGGIPISVVHVVEDSGLAGAGGDDSVFSITEAVQSCETFSKWRGIELTTRIVEGNVVKHFAAHTEPSDLLVVGLKGRFARVGVGSTTRWLVSHLRAPLMVIAGSSDRVLNRLIAPHDGSGSAAKAVGLAHDLAQQVRWPMTVLAVPSMDHALDDVLEQAQSLAPEAQVITFDLAGRAPAQLIEEVLTEAKHALLVLGAYGESWFRQTLHGGTTGHVLKHIRGPVILVPRIL